MVIYFFPYFYQVSLSKRFFEPQSSHFTFGSGCTVPFKKTRLFAVQLWPLFFLKYFFRRAMLQLEIGLSKPDESHSEQSETKTRKTAFCSSKTLKSCAGDWPTATGCPVSNPDNNCANGPLNTVHSVFFSKTLFDFIKSISGLIELKFSGKTPNEVLYAPIYFWGVYF